MSSRAVLPTHPPPNLPDQFSFYHLGDLLHARVHVPLGIVVEYFNCINQISLFLAILLTEPQNTIFVSALFPSQTIFLLLLECCTSQKLQTPKRSYCWGPLVRFYSPIVLNWSVELENVEYLLMHISFFKHAPGHIALSLKEPSLTTLRVFFLKVTQQFFV